MVSLGDRHDGAHTFTHNVFYAGDRALGCHEGSNISDLLVLRINCYQSAEQKVFLQRNNTRRLLLGGNMTATTNECVQ